MAVQTNRHDALLHPGRRMTSDILDAYRQPWQRSLWLAYQSTTIDPLARSGDHGEVGIARQCFAMVVDRLLSKRRAIAEDSILPTTKPQTIAAAVDFAAVSDDAAVGGV